MDRVYDENNWKDKYKLLHEIGHCQLITGQGEFESVTHMEYAKVTICMLILSIWFNSIFIVVGFICLSINMYLKFDRRHRLSVLGYAEFLADSFALRYFYNQDKNNFENARNYIIEKYEKDIERSKESKSLNLIRFKHAISRMLYISTPLFGKHFLSEAGNLVGGYRMPQIPILLFNIFSLFIVYFECFNHSRLLIIPVVIITVMNFFKYFGQNMICSELSIEVQKQFNK